MYPAPAATPNNSRRENDSPLPLLRPALDSRSPADEDASFRSVAVDSFATVYSSTRDVWSRVMCSAVGRGRQLSFGAQLVDERSHETLHDFTRSGDRCLHRLAQRHRRSSQWSASITADG